MKENLKEQIVGYLLLIIGIGVMWYSLMQVYMLLTNQIKPFQVYSASTSKPAAKPATSAQDLLTNTSAITEMQTELFSKLIDKEMNRSLNMGMTLFFLYFIMLFGFRLSSLGVQLVRPIKVKLRSSIAELVDEDTKKEVPAKPLEVVKNKEQQPSVPEK